jgi:hypothetical protein
MYRKCKGGCQRKFGFFFGEGSIYKLLFWGVLNAPKNLGMGQSMWLIFKVKIKVVGASPSNKPAQLRRLKNIYFWTFQSSKLD